MWCSGSWWPPFAAAMAATVLGSGRGASGFLVGTARMSGVVLWSTPEDQGSDPTYGQGPVTDEDEARLAELVKTRMEELESSEQSKKYEEELSEDMAIELRRRLSKLPMKERIASDRRVIESIFEVAQEDIRSWGESMREENKQRAQEALSRMDEDIAAQNRAFATQMDAILIEEAGIDPMRLSAKESSESKVIAKQEFFADTVAPNSVQEMVWPPVAGEVVLGIVQCGTDDQLPSLMANELRSSGYDVVATSDSFSLAETSLAAATVLCGPDFRSTAGFIERAAAAVSTGGLLVAASRHGATRTNELGFALRNARGALTRAREFEDAVKFAARRRGLSYAVVRLGDLSKPASGKAELELGDSLDAACSIQVAAKALSNTCLTPAARNQTFTVAGKEDPDDWDDLFLKLDGPELARYLAADGVKAAELVEWLREWANLWTTPSAPLTTPVTVEAAPDGANLLFVDTKQKRPKAPRARRKSNNGGLRLLVDTDPFGRVRVRAKRTPYDEGLVVKEMSETEIVVRLKRDFERQWR